MDAPQEGEMLLSWFLDILMTLSVCVLAFLGLFWKSERTVVSEVHGFCTCFLNGGTRKFCLRCQYFEDSSWLFEIKGTPNNSSCYKSKL